MFRKYEKKGAPLLGKWEFFLRVMGSCLTVLGVTVFSLLLGTMGYSLLAPCPWIDGMHNAAMILAGMGPVIEIHTDAGKFFSTFFALYCGIVYLTLMGILLAPFYHRALHRFHLEEDEPKVPPAASNHPRA
jgi:hypothetical protein